MGQVKISPLKSECPDGESARSNRHQRGTVHNLGNFSATKAKKLAAYARMLIKAGNAKKSVMTSSE